MNKIKNNGNSTDKNIYTTTLNKKKIGKKWHKEYPMFDGKSLDKIHKMEFDYWKGQFLWAINTTNKEMDENIKETIAWNCAFLIATKVTESNYKIK